MQVNAGVPKVMKLNDGIMLEYICYYKIIISLNPNFSWMNDVVCIL